MNYQECSVEELAQHILISSRQLTAQQLRYYKNQGNLEMVDKITQAKRLAKRYLLLQRAALLE